MSATLPERLGNATLAERLKSAGTGSATIGPEFFAVDWSDAARSGNVERGRKLFSADGIGCAKCHALRADAPAGGGPSLADAARRFTPAHLVESILLPSKQISPLFRATQILTVDGRTLIGDTGLDDFVELDEPLYALGYFWLMMSGAGAVSLDYLLERFLQLRGWSESKAGKSERL